ncbi:DUF962 domain-containing protein [Colwellia sp. D2M02]|uniref:Mpo1 family 2-hydroxy fatty acid dioxygenase n=1 Tax=Colwellia sp. D2M02 TaxID=2841562 RepID=UPI001C09D82E|nr:Mpo1-like protein [Colwellia sp. D2M02]MBU2893739.1 DUF962 domain-containing protein [Colwellia sp. D2M02]
MKSITEQLARYKSVHLNSKNISSHFVGVPLIVFAVTLLLNTITFELEFSNLFDSALRLKFTLAMVIFTFVALYYLLLHRLLALGMVGYILLNLYLAHLCSDVSGILSLAIGLFVVGWIVQFIGHYYEKAKPAFVDDLSQFLIGPLFLMAEVYFMLGLAPKLNAKVSVLAREKRKALDAKNAVS